LLTRSDLALKLQLFGLTVLKKLNQHPTILKCLSKQ
jgi:hypothetical protein